MLGCDKTVTVVNLWHDKAAVRDVYCCHVFHGCSWYARQIHTADTAGLHRSALHQIRIPEASAAGAVYCEPGAWAALPAEQRTAAWTLGQNAKLVLGEVYALDDAGYAALTKQYTVAAGLSWHDNRGRANPHWYVEGS